MCAKSFNKNMTNLVNFFEKNCGGMCVWVVRWHHSPAHPRRKLPISRNKRVRCGNPTHIDVVLLISQEEVVHDGGLVQLRQRGHVLHPVDAAGMHRVHRLPAELCTLKAHHLEPQAHTNGTRHVKILFVRGGKKIWTLVKRLFYRVKHNGKSTKEGRQCLFKTEISLYHPQTGCSERVRQIRVAVSCWFLLNLKLVSAIVCTY